MDPDSPNTPPRSFHYTGEEPSEEPHTPPGVPAQPPMPNPFYNRILFNTSSPGSACGPAPAPSYC
jgi:hypothetical protein